jgi:hypothetical protein
MPLGLEAGRTNHPYSFDPAEDFEGMKFRVPELLLGCLLTVAVLSIGLTLSSSFHHVVATAQAETVDERLAIASRILKYAMPSRLRVPVHLSEMICHSDTGATKPAKTYHSLAAWLPLSSKYPVSTSIGKPVAVKHSITA